MTISIYHDNYAILVHISVHYKSLVYKFITVRHTYNKLKHIYQPQPCYVKYKPENEHMKFHSKAIYDMHNNVFVSSPYKYQYHL